MKKQLIILVLVLGIIACCGFCCGSGCYPPPPPPPPPGGFTIEAEYECTNEFLQIMVCPEPGLQIGGVYVSDIPGFPAQGDTENFLAYTCEGALCCGGLGTLCVSGGRFPGKWTFTEYGMDPNFPNNNPSCYGKSYTAPFTTSPIPLTCDNTVAGVTVTALTIDPTVFSTVQPPQSATISGPAGGFDPTYGMPLIQYFDSTGTLQAQTYASAVTPDGSALSGPVPDFSSSLSGQYIGTVSNAASDASYNLVGAASVQVITVCP